MGKNIVVITGSPRRNGNSFAMTDAFIRAAQEKGHTVTRFDAAFRKVGGCRACETCYRTGKACSFDDDFNEIAPAILAAKSDSRNLAILSVFTAARNSRLSAPVSVI